MSLMFDNPVQPVLALPPDLALWQQCESLPNPAGGWRVYLHRLGQAALQAWFREDFGQPTRLWPTDDPTDLWPLVDGLALTLGSRRIVVMLSETIEAATLRVPQEWVDLPAWAADYYLAAHVDVDEQRLGLWGYATYDQVKTQGEYEPSDRTYSLSDGDLIQDFSVFWVAQQLEQPQAISIPALPTLSAIQAEGLIERLAGAVEPRLDISFGQWGALLNNGRWRRQLCQRRQGKTPVDLSRWMGHFFDQGWQALETLLPQSPALAFRSSGPSDRVVSRGKAICLDPPGCYLVLGLRIAMTDSGNEPSPSNNLRSISVQLFPTDVEVLPQGVTLSLELPETAEPLQTVQAGEYDNYIQLPSFRCPPGQRFRVSIQLGDAMVHEEFIS